MAEREEKKRQKLKIELETDVAGTCAGRSDCNSEKSGKQQQPTAKKKPNHKLKFKVRLSN